MRLLASLELLPRLPSQKISDIPTLILIKEKKYIKYISGDLPFYIKGTGGMTDNLLSINPTTLQIGRVTVPESIAKPVAGLIEDMIERRIAQIGGADIKDASFKNGVFHLDGTVPETIKY